MSDQIINAAIARSIQADVVRTHPLAAWVIARDQIDYPGQLVARLVTSWLTPYVLPTLGWLARPTAAWFGALGAAAV